jgi:phytoene desaturase
MTRSANGDFRRVAVVGGGLGGLSAAIHLRLRGFEVTLYEANESVGGRASQIKSEGFTFDTGPTLLNYPWVFEQLFSAAGCRLDEYVDLQPIDPSIRFYWPQGDTLQLTSSLTGLVREFERVAPGSGPGLFAFLADASDKYRITFEKLACRNIDNPVKWFASLSPKEFLRTGIWRSLDRELSRFFRNRFIREALGSYGMYLGGSPQELPGIFTILSYGEIAMGLWLPRGGIFTLVKGIEALARRAGVHILTGQRVKQILVRDGNVAGLKLADGRTDDFPIVVSNVDVPATQHHLLASNGARPPKPMKMTPSVMTFYLGVRGKIRNSDHHTIFMPQEPEKSYEQLIRRQEIPRELPFYMSIASKTDPSLAPPGDSTVFILVPLPQPFHLDQEDWPALTQELKQRIFKRLDRHGINFSTADIVTEKVMTPEDWGKQFGLFQGSAFGASHTLFQMGSFRYPNRDRHVKGLYYTGASTTPGTGLPMVVLSGKMTAERVCTDVC